MKSLLLLPVFGLLLTAGHEPASCINYVTEPCSFEVDQSAASSAWGHPGDVQQMRVAHGAVCL